MGDSLKAVRVVMTNKEWWEAAGVLYQVRPDLARKIAHQIINNIRELIAERDAPALEGEEPRLPVPE